MRLVQSGFLISVFCILFAGCAQVRVVTPNPRVEPPETRGDQYKWKFGVSGGNAHMFRVTGDGGKRPPTMDEPQVRGHVDVHPAGYFTLHERIDVGGELNVLGTGMNAIAKWQFLGAGTSQAAEGNIPVALFMRTGFARSGNSGDQKETFGDGGYNWSGKTDNRFVHGGISAGYRVSDHALIYGGVAFGQYWAESTISQDNTDSEAGGSYHKSYSGDGKTAALGALFNWRVVQFYVSGEYTRIDYGNTDDLESLFLHTGVIFTPGGKNMAR